MYIPRPRLARNLNEQSRRADLDPLSADQVAYTQEAIGGLHRALHDQIDPVFHRPKHPVTGWGLTSTALENYDEAYGVPMVTLLGHRTIYLAQNIGDIKRVLTVPHPRRAMEERVIQISNTTIPELLTEDPSLYGALIASAIENVIEYDLDYSLGPRPRTT